MFDALKPLLESGIVNDETRQAINEAWETKLTEAREEIRSELRDEFSQKYTHDKSVMVEALDKMVTESLSEEIAEFNTEKKQMAADRAKYTARMMEGANKFDSFMVTKLAEEIKELRSDRKQYENSIGKLEEFVVKALAEELQEFEKDKQAVVETKVRLIAEAKSKMVQLQEAFVSKSAKLVKEMVASNLESELTQLKEDITLARENMFGRKIFEAFVSEFAGTHLNENAEVAKLKKQIDEGHTKLAEADKAIHEAKSIAELKNKEIQVIKESVERTKSMSALLKPLNKEKATVMSELLESVQTANLQKAYEKYLPAVLGGNSSVQPKSEKRLVTESSEVTGDKKTATKTAATQNDDANVIELKKLAGLK